MKFESKSDVNAANLIDDVNQPVGRGYVRRCDGGSSHSGQLTQQTTNMCFYIKKGFYWI